MRNLIGIGLLLAATPALAQSWGNSSLAVLPERPPNLRPADASVADGRAKASAEVLAVIAAAKDRSTRVMQVTDAANIRSLLLIDGTLDEAELDLLDELTASAIRAITVSPLSGNAQPVITGTVSGDTRRVLEGPLEQRYRAMWDAKDPVEGWMRLLREARRSDASHSRVRAFLATMTLQAARESTAANVYRPLTQLVAAFSSRNEKLPLADRTLGRRLQYEAFVDGDFFAGGQMPDFIYSWLKLPPKQ